MTNDTPGVRELLRFYQARVERGLDHWLPAAHTHPQRLHEAMRYAALGSGKRIRPALVYSAGQAVGVDPAGLDGPACAVELVHAYSLVHDDLPAMDDDDLRRGRPTTHRAFDEATAILAGDALQALAFYILAHDRAMTADAGSRVRMVELLALACGSRGMAGGQAIDLASVGESLSIAQIEDMHIHKTGALIRAAIMLGALSQPDADDSRVEALDYYGKCIGLAFQIQDDVLDVEGNTETLGKSHGADVSRNKPTYPAVVGLSEAKTRARDLHGEAVSSLEGLGDAVEPLRGIADFIIERIH